MTKTLCDLRSGLVELYESEDWDAALVNCMTILKGVPGNFEARIKIGDILLKMGMGQEAQTVFAFVARHFIKAGFPLLGIVAAKMLPSSQESYQDLMELITNLYSSDSEQLAADAPHPQLPNIEMLSASEAEEAIQSTGSLVGDQVAQTAVQVAIDAAGLAEYPKKLPVIPIFSDLDAEAFRQLLTDLKVRRCARGEELIREGQTGDSFFMVARGIVEVVKRVGDEEVRLTELADGTIFGEMALISNKPRSATVRSMTYVDLLELSREDLDKEAHRYQSVAKALYRFTRARMLDNMVVRSAVFKELPQVERTALLDKFDALDVKKGQVLIEEGKKGEGLFVILHGDAEVVKKDGDDQVPLAHLEEGEVFGEISLVREVPTTATVTAGRDGKYLFLSSEEFEKQIARNPSLWRTLTEISEKRLKETAQRLEGPELLGADEFILI